MKFISIVAAVLLTAAGWGGENLIKNPGFETPGQAPGTAAEWTRQILMPGAKASLKTVKDPKNKSTVLETYFLGPDRAEGARFFQHVELQPRRVYKLSYEYRSDWDGRLLGDVMMTETGNGIYNIMMCPPNTAWTKIVRYIPVCNDKVKTGGVYVQNRSQIPLWYDNISLEETDIPVQEILDNQFKITLHPLTEKDIMLMPDYEGDITFIAQIFKPSFVDEKNLVVEARVIQGKEIQRGGDFPVKLDEGKTMRFSVPAKLVAKGESKLVVILKSTDGTVYQHSNIDIERFASVEVGQAVDLEHTPMLRHNGENFFPIAFYGVPIDFNKTTGEFMWGEGYHKDIKPYAYNTLQNYIFGGYAQPNLTPKLERQLAFLDATAKEGKMMMVELPRTLVEYDREKDLEDWIRTVDKHPATLYFRSEEMMHFRKTPIKYLANASRTIKKVNPQRQYLLFDGLTADMVQYIDGLDSGISNKFMAVKYRQQIGADRIMLATINIEWPGRKSPDMDEQRYHTFMPVIHGARGVAFFMWSIARFQATDKDYVHRIGRSVDELAQVTPALTQDKPLPEWYPEIKVEGNVSILRVGNWLLAGPSFPNSTGTVSFKLPEGIKLQRCFSEAAEFSRPQEYRFNVEPLRVLVLKFLQ